MNALDQKIADLNAAVTKETTAVDSAIALINGIGARIDAAVAAAIAAGATADELTAITDLSTSLSKNADDLSAAVVANTPPAPPTPIP